MSINVIHVGQVASALAMASAARSEQRPRDSGLIGICVLVRLMTGAGDRMDLQCSGRVAAPGVFLTRR